MIQESPVGDVDAVCALVPEALAGPPETHSMRQQNAGGKAVPSGDMSYRTFRGHVGRSGHIADIA